MLSKLIGSLSTIISEHSFIIYVRYGTRTFSPSLSYFSIFSVINSLTPGNRGVRSLKNSIGTELQAHNS